MQSSLLKAGWFMLAFGIILGIVGTIFLTETDAGRNILESLICQENETLTMDTGTGIEGQTSVSVGCIKNDGGAPVDVTGKLFLVIGVLMLPLILSSPLLLIGNITRAKSKGQTNE